MARREQHTTPSLLIHRSQADKRRREVALEAGVGPAFVSQIEACRKGARPSTVEAMADAVYVGPDDLVREPDPLDDTGIVSEERAADGGSP